MDEACIRCFQNGILGFVGGVNTHANTPIWVSKRTQRPGTTVELQIPIRGHYCQTVERKLPGAHWLPTYLLQQFNYKFDNMKHCSHSMWQYFTTDNKNWEQLAEKSSEKAHFFHIFTPRVVFASTLVFVVSHCENKWAALVLLDPNSQLVKWIRLIGCCCHNKLEQGHIFYYSLDQHIAKLICEH